MAKLFPETTLTIEGRVYRLVLDVNAQILAEEQASTPTRDASFRSLAESAQKGRMTAARLLLWASLQRHHPDVTLEQAGELMSSTDMAALSAVRQAMQETVPDPADVKELGEGARPPKAQPPIDGIGGRSKLRSVVGG